MSKSGRNKSDINKWNKLKTKINICFEYCSAGFSGKTCKVSLETCNKIANTSAKSKNFLL